jgi:hypothetical protein
MVRPEAFETIPDRRCVLNAKARQTFLAAYERRMPNVVHPRAERAAGFLPGRSGVARESAGAGGALSRLNASWEFMLHG